MNNSEKDNDMRSERINQLKLKFNDLHLLCVTQEDLDNNTIECVSIECRVKPKKSTEITY